MAGFFSDIGKVFKTIVEASPLVHPTITTTFVPTLLNRNCFPTRHDEEVSIEHVLFGVPRQLPRDDTITQMREEVHERRRNVEDLSRRIRETEQKARDDHLKYERRREKSLAKLARRAQAKNMKGHNIGIFGLTSTGKSTMVNSLLGYKAADIGVGETTKQMTPYYGQQYTLWDTPGRNDELTYSNQQYISFIKGLRRRLIVIQYTIKENLSLIRLLDDLGLGYDIVVNKFDDVDQDEQRPFKKQIKMEIESLKLKQMKNIFFLSAQHPKMFHDWLKMVDCLTEECLDYDKNTDTDSSVTSDSD